MFQFGVSEFMLRFSRLVSSTIPVLTQPDITKASTDAQRVDPGVVPHRALYTGARIPAIGLGTFGSDRVSGQEVAQAVIGAAEVGYRHFDCAAVYNNEDIIGRSLKRIMAGGVKREDLWITSIIRPDATFTLAARMPTLTFTMSSWLLGFGWKGWSNLAWSGTSVRRT